MMKTKLLNNTNEDILIAAEILKNGGIVAIPTETVYGLAADAMNTNAIKKIFKAKGRPQNNPLIVHISNINDVHKLTTDFNEKAKKLSSVFWPGALTLILKKVPNVNNIITAGLSTIAVRFPNNDVTLKLMQNSGLMLAAPSANISGKPSPTKAKHVLDDLNNKIDAILDGGNCDVGLESTVVSLVENIPRILRPGIITPEQIKNVLDCDVLIDEGVFNEVNSTKKEISSPGMLHKHYAPNADVIVINSSSEKYINYVNNKYSSQVAALCFKEDLDKLKVKTFCLGSKNNLNDIAKNLFMCLRKIDEDENIKLVFAHSPSNNGIGMAIYNRLIRSANFKVVNL